MSLESAPVQYWDESDLPVQGTSGAGHGLGLLDHRSGLIIHCFRLLDATRG